MTTLTSAVNRAGNRIRERELGKNSVIEEKKASLLQQLEELTGEEFGVYKKKHQNLKVAFAQLIQHNVQLLVEIGYLTQSEESFLFRISGFLDFKTNVIVEKDYKNRKAKDYDPNELPKAATVKYISGLVGLSREHTSRMMNGLKEKGVLATAETGMRTEDGRACSSRTWLVNPNIMYCGDKSDIDRTVQLIFKNALMHLKDEKGKKVKLPVKLFV